MYESGLGSRNSATDDDEGYFSAAENWSFLGLDGFDIDKLVRSVVDFLRAPENTEKEVLILDAMGQGVPGTELRKLVLAQVPSARMTVLATTLTPRRNTDDEVIEFNNDALSEKYSEPLFAEIEKRKSSGAALFITCFRPGGGMEYASDNAYVQYSLYKQLRKLFAATNEKGLLFLQSPSDKTELSFLRELLIRYGAENLLITRGDRVGVLRADSSLCPNATLPKINGALSLPSTDELLEKHWDLVKKYWSVPID